MQPAAVALETHAILGIANHLLAIPSSRVEELFVLSEVHNAPGTPPTQRGVISLRGRVLPVVDVRAALGLPPALDELNEFLDLLSAREQDHKNWLSELEASVREARPFKLTTDPHKCKFGVWYDHFKTDNVVISAELSRFAEPHAAIHAVAIEVERSKADGHVDRALARVEETKRGLLSELVSLFERTREAVRSEHREIGVVVSAGGNTAVLAVDRAEAVAPVEPIAMEDDPVRGGAIAVDLVTALVRWRERPQPILLPNLERLVASAG